MATPKFNVAPALSVPFQTLDATPIVAAEFDATQYPLDVFFFEVKVVAAFADGSKGSSFWLQATFRSAADGTLTQIGSTRTIATANIDSGGPAACTVAASGTKAQVTVTGIAATTINWVLDNTIRHAPFSR